MNLFYKGLISTVLAITLLAGCGGGGDSSSITNIGDNFANSVLAEADLNNAKEIENVVLSNNAGAYSLNSISKENNVSLLLISQNILELTSKHVKLSNLSNNSLNEAINETFYCSDSGNYTTTGTVSSNGDANMIISYNSCKIDNTTITGILDVKLRDFDLSEDDWRTSTIKYINNYEILTNSISVIVKAGSYVNQHISSFSPLRTTIGMTIVGSGLGISFGVENAVYNISETSSTTSMYITKGRFYGDSLGIYVDYDTSYDMSQTPLVYSDFGTFQNGGETRFKMKDDGKMKIVIVNGHSISYVDADGDGTYELIERLN